MADIHVLAGDGRGNFSVVMHVAVPDTNNAVDVNWRTALVASGIRGSTQLVDAVDDGDPSGWEITAAEKAKVESGELIEHRADCMAESGGSGVAAKQDTLRALYEAKQTEVLAKLQKQLRYFGHTETAT